MKRQLYIAVVFAVVPPEDFPPPPPLTLSPSHLVTSSPVPARPLVDRIESYTVYDGDTLSGCRIDLGYGITLTDSVRIVGVDCPEVTGPSREAGLLVRDAVKAWLANHRELWLIGRGREKFGRILGDVHPPGVGQSLASWLLEKGYAKPTGEGGKRPAWSQAELDAIAGR